MTKKLTIEEYKEIGNELRGINEKLTKAYILLAKGNNLKSKEVIEFKNLLKTFDKCKSSLDDLVREQYPNTENTQYIFYGALPVKD